MEQWSSSLARLLSNVPRGFEKFLPEDQRPSESDRKESPKQRTPTIDLTRKTSQTDESKMNSSKVEPAGNGEEEGEGEGSSNKKKGPKEDVLAVARSFLLSRRQ
eukprot:GILJ01007981.1.p1 GENE.GILJ01007981.1~~GILJ01007981.1.p1  ORF type:complete len:104 (+),score=12.31 GILJ01007981.1:223-534(+)